MKLTRVNVEEMRSYKKTKWDEVLDEFYNMNVAVAEITEFTNKNAYSCCYALAHAIERRKAYTLGAKVSNGRVFLYNKLLLQENKED